MSIFMVLIKQWSCKDNSWSPCRFCHILKYNAVCQYSKEEVLRLCHKAVRWRSTNWHHKSFSPQHIFRQSLHFVIPTAAGCACGVKYLKTPCRPSVDWVLKIKLKIVVFYLNFVYFFNVCLYVHIFQIQESLGCCLWRIEKFWLNTVHSVNTVTTLLSRFRIYT